VFIVLLVYAVSQILLNNKIVVFKRNRKFGSADNIEEESQGVNLDEMIATAEANGDLRAATRFRYLKLLQDLHDRGLIRMHAEQTNWDYVQQLARHPLKKRFRYLTVAYEYVWYGEFQPGIDQYEILKNSFQNFLH
jgi:hypothetical protein